MAAVPPSLKSIKPYIERAAELKSKDPIVAYHCGLYALQEAMKLRAQLPKEDMGFVIGLMDQLEAEKGALGEMDSPAVLVENFAQDLFQRADDSDRAGRHDMIKVASCRGHIRPPRAREAASEGVGLPSALGRGD